MQHFLLACAALSVVRCSGCGDPGTLSATHGALSASPRSIDFGDVFLGAEARQTIRLTAVGALGVGYSAAFAGDALGFEAGPATGQVVPGGGVDVTVLFRPARPGANHLQVVFESHAGAAATATVAVNVTGVGVPPPDCDDGNGCTVDSFNLATGRCEHTTERISCDDFNACTTSDTCVNGVCLGESFSCDDHDVCTDDLCDPQQGCVHRPARSCEDDNPCTADTCDPVQGCQHTEVADGTPCHMGQQCSFADICIHGACVGVSVPDGTPCDDGDPCSKHDQCVDGTCKDPTYKRPGLGELKFATDVGPLATGASANPIVDRDSTVFVGVEGGVVAVDQCGAPKWKNTTLGTPRFGAAVSLPGLLVLPIGSKIVDVDASSGAVIRTLDLATVFGRRMITTASTATASVRLLDLALRASGALVASVVREHADGTIEGMLAEIDLTHTVATPLRELGDRHASRIAVDADEGVVAILRAGIPDKGVAPETLVRFGIAGLPATSWSASPIDASHTELAFAGASQVLWTSGLVTFERDGVSTTLQLAPAVPDTFAWGSPAVSATAVFLARAVAPPMPPATPLTANPGTWELAALDLGSGVVTWRAPLDASAEDMSPAVDLAGNVYLATADGTVHGFSALGQLVFVANLPLGNEPVDHVALGIAPDGVVVAIARGRVFGVQSMSPLGNGAWPRARRDDLATGHR